MMNFYFFVEIKGISNNDNTDTIYDDTVCDNDDNSIPFIISFAISAGINLLLVAVITLTCLVLKQKKNKPVLTNYRYENYNYSCSFIIYVHIRFERQRAVKNDPIYEIPTLERQAAQKQKSSHYVNLPQRQVTQKKRVKPDDGTSDIKLEDNPSYRTASYGNL